MIFENFINIKKVKGKYLAVVNEKLGNKFSKNEIAKIIIKIYAKNLAVKKEWKVEKTSEVIEKLLKEVFLKIN